MHIRLIAMVLAALFLANCGGGSGGGDDNANGASLNTVELKVIGLRAAALGGNLVLKFPDGSTRTVTSDGTYSYDNSSNPAALSEFGLSSQPNDQACFARVANNGASTGTAVINILCGYRNEIRVSGIEGALDIGDPLIITRDLFYYENQNGAVSPLAIKTITQNSTAFNPDLDGSPKDSTYYSFIYGMPSSSVANYEQDLRIVSSPNDYECLSFKGAQGFYQIVCNKKDSFEERYELAQKCVAIQASDSLGYITANGPSEYNLQTDLSLAEKFFVKPAHMGSYMLYDRDEYYLAHAGGQLIRSTFQGVAQEWSITDRQSITMLAGQAGFETRQRLAPDGDPRILQHDLALHAPISEDPHQDLSYQTRPDSFEFIEVDASECTEHPEASLNATIDPSFYNPKDPTQPIYGYADIHAHYAFPKTMGGMAMSGEVVHPWGIKHAMENCHSLHGADGSLDLLASQTGLGSTHAIDGYPDFVEWPSKDAITHVQAYYRWIERAYLSGLRLSVNLATGNPSFCQALERIVGLGQKEHGCSGLESVSAQNNYIKWIEEYIDAQAGGPGKGWFRVVHSSQEAREVIADNKLAVILGVEHGTLFSCRESSTCSNAYIDESINALYDVGVRAVFPVHRFDNKFAGTRPGGGARGAWMNLASKLDSSNISGLGDLIPPGGNYYNTSIGGHYIEVEQCPPGTNGVSDMYSMQTFRNVDMSILTDALPGVFGSLLAGIIDTNFGPYDDYAGITNACNVRGLHPSGQHLITRLMEKGMFIDVGHLSQSAMLETLDMIEANNYPAVVNSHGWIDNATSTHNRIFDAGGSIGIFNTTPQNFANSIANYRTILTNTSYPKSFALGSDIQGVTSQPGPENPANANVVSHPFMSLDGTVTFHEPQTGNRTFDYNTEGIAHYGLYAEWLESFKQEDIKRGDDTISSFMNSAEAYIQMWERAEAHVLANQ